MLVMIAMVSRILADDFCDGGDCGHEADTAMTSPDGSDDGDGDDVDGDNSDDAAFVFCSHTQILTFRKAGNHCNAPAAARAWSRYQVDDTTSTPKARSSES